MQGRSIGIDLGTTHCVLSILNRNEEPQIIPDEFGNNLIPSMIAFSQKEQLWLFGDRARRQLVQNPDNTVFDLKLLLGRNFNDPEIQNLAAFLPYTLVSKRGRVAVRLRVENGRNVSFYPEELTAKLLDYIVNQAALYLELPLDRTDSSAIQNIVLSVPSHYNSQQIAATMDSAKISGLRVLRFVTQSTCAALSYYYGLACRKGKWDEEEYVVIVFDLGGGTLDVSLLTIEDGIFEVVAISGNTSLGGEYFTQTLAKYCTDQFMAKHGGNETLSSRDLARLYLKCEEAKVAITKRNKINICIENFSENKDLNQMLTQTIFEDINKDYFEKLLDPVEKVLKDARIRKKNIDQIVMVGGSTRIPKVQQLISEYFKRKPLNIVSQGEVVAKGAAIHASQLSGMDDRTIKNLLLLNVIPHSLSVGVATSSDKKADRNASISNKRSKNTKSESIVKRQTTISAKKTKTITTAEDNQTSMFLTIFSGDHSDVEKNLILDTMEIKEIPPLPKGEAKIDITFDLLEANSDFDVTCNSFGKSTKKIINFINLSNDELKWNISALKEQKINEIDKEQRAEQASELKENLDNPKARKDLIEMQREMFGILFKMSRGNGNRDRIDKMESLWRSMKTLVKSEMDRFERLIAARIMYYKKAQLRWGFLSEVKGDNEATTAHIQPVGFNMKINNPSIGKEGLRFDIPFMTTKLSIDKIDHVLVSQTWAQLLMQYFKFCMTPIVDELNASETLGSLDLPQSKKATLPFLDDPQFLIGGKRVSLSFGPVKRTERAQVKVNEYQKEIDNGRKRKHLDGRALGGIDYVLDWLRSTVTSEDPYVLFVFFQLLQRSPHLTIQRIKNNIAFPRDGDDAHILPMILINLHLLYPTTEQEYNTAPLSLLGPFEADRSGEPLTSCEVQLTLQDFLVIRRLRHAYSNIDGTEDPHILFKKPLFLERDTLVEKEPSVVKDMRGLEDCSIHI